MFCRLGGLAPSSFGYLFLSLLAYSLVPCIQARLSFSCIYLQAAFLGYDNVCFTFPLPCQAITLWMQACCFTFPVPCLSHVPWVWQCLVLHSCYPFPPSPFQFTRCVCVTQSHPNLFEWTVGWIKPWVTFALDVSRCSPKLSRPSSSFIQSPIIVHHLYRLIQNQIKPQKIKIKNRKTENKLELYGFL